MEEHTETTKEWLKKELMLINNEMADTLNGRFQPELEGCEPQSMELTLRFLLKDWQVNGIGTLHGGIISAMMDLTMSMAVYCYSRQSVPPTITMTTNYLRPVPMEGPVLVRAKVTSIGKRNATAYCETIISSNSITAATALGTYAVIPAKKI